MHRLQKKVVQLFSSLTLTLWCLFFLFLLLFLGIISQENMGMYQMQRTFFHSLFVYWPISPSIKIPIFPGGFLIGSLLAINLVTTIIVRKYFQRKKWGILSIHTGLLLLMVGGLLIRLFSFESQLSLKEGESKSYSEDKNYVEFILSTEPDAQSPIVQRTLDSLQTGTHLSPSSLPFTIQFKLILDDAKLIQTHAPVSQPSHSGLPTATHGVGQHTRVIPIHRAPDDNTIKLTSAYIELIANQQSIGIWLLSRAIHQMQRVTIDDQTYYFKIRPIQHPLPYTVTLKKFNHIKYQGHPFPKFVSSIVHINNPANNDSREFFISLNNPLRYQGTIFFQSGFRDNDTVSIFQVVQNRVWITPYIACALIFSGLIGHFISKLIARMKS